MKEEKLKEFENKMFTHLEKLETVNLSGK